MTFIKLCSTSSKVTSDVVVPRQRGRTECPPRHLDITVALAGQVSNRFSVLGRYPEAARNAGGSDVEIAAFMDEAMEGGYDHLLQTAMRWFEIR